VLLSVTTKRLLRFGQRHQRLRLLKRRRQRLVADHVDAGFEEGGGDRRVQMVGRDDDHCLDAVRPCRLGLRHGAVVGIATLRRDADLGGGGRGIVRIRRQRAGDQRDLIVEPHRQPVHGADEGIAAASDHSNSQALARGSVRGCIDHDRDYPPDCSGVLLWRGP
jgi:hypothetical protein